MPLLSVVLRTAHSLRRPHKLRRLSYIVDRTPITAVAVYAQTRTLMTASSSSPGNCDLVVPRLTPRLVRLDLGNNIIVNVPVSSPSASSSPSRALNGKEAVRRKQQKRRAAQLNPKQSSLHVLPESVAGVLADSVASSATQSHTKVETPDNRLSKSNVVAEPSTTIASMESTTFNDGFVVPHTGAAAAALLDATTLFESLGIPASAASFSLPLASHKTSLTELEAAREANASAQANFIKLRTTALPCLFAFAEQQLMREEEQQQVLGTSSASSLQTFKALAVSVRQDEVTDAVECLAEHLSNIAHATRRDGRRHVAALPPTVVAALWDRVMPFLHALAFPRGNASTGGGRRTIKETGEETAEHEKALEALDDAAINQNAEEISKKNKSETASSRGHPPLPWTQSTSLASKVASSTAGFKISYLAARRTLALHTRNVASLFPPDALSMVLTRLLQCKALSDDVLGPIIADLMENRQQQLKQSLDRHTATSSVATVGGTIAILQERILQLDATSDGKGDSIEGAGSHHFKGATAVTMARLLGKAAIPGHHQLHRFFHLALLPEVTRVLRTTATAAVKMIKEQRKEMDVSVSYHRKLQTNDGNSEKALSVETEKALVAVLPGTEALLDLTAAFRHYAVSGDAVQYLTTLWHLQFRLNQQRRERQHTLALAPWGDCGAVLRALSAVPIASSRSQRRQARQQQNSTSIKGRQGQLLLHMAEEDYFPLVDEVCAQVRELSEAAVTAVINAGAAAPAVDGGSADINRAIAAAPPETALMPPPQYLLALLRMLLRVNSPHWAETYNALATAIFVHFSSQLSTSSSTATGTATLSVDLQSLLEKSFPLTDTQRTVKALLHRNSLIPDNPLHRVLLRRLLYAPEALTDPAVAATALIGLEVMIPIKEGNASFSAEHPPSSEGVVETQTSEAVPMSPSDEFTITVNDRVRALRLLRRFGRSMNPTAFVAGLCVAPIHQLPLPAQMALVNHLSAVASAVSPTYLVKGMAAVVSQLNPTAIDDVSVQKWYSRFTARDVVRRVDSASCAVLLDILSSHPRFERNCALSKHAITRQIGVALLSTGDDDALTTTSSANDGATGHSCGKGDSSSTLTLEQLPQVVAALRRAHVFSPPYFSRVCRLLLGQVETAPLGDLLLPFSATAEEFMRRQQREAQASVFKDVWELLRGRVLEQAATLSLEETCTALSAFAALDVTDAALFGVLVYQLWTCVQREARIAVSATGKDTHYPSGSSKFAAPASVPLPIGPGEKAENDAQEVKRLRQADSTTAAGATTSTFDEAQEAMVRHLAQLGQHITRTLSPSAIAVVVTTLCARDALNRVETLSEKRVRTIDKNCFNEFSGNDGMVRTMLPWMLIALHNCRAELYPIDVVHVLPSLAQRHAATLQMADALPSINSKAATINTNTMTPTDVYVASLLHAAYDACRTTFLSMYAILPGLPSLDSTNAASPTAAAATQIKNDASNETVSTLTSAEVKDIAEQRAAWTPAVKLSVQVVPRPWFVTLLLSLSSAGLADVDVGLACVERGCTRRVCGTQLSTDQLVDLCLTMCWLFRVSDFAMQCPQEGELHSEKASAEEITNAAPTKNEVPAAEIQTPAHETTPATSHGMVTLRTGMATVLSALWFRSDELSTPQIHALLRCLRDTYGADRVDDDFVQRLEAQKALIQKRKKSAVTAAAKSVGKDEFTETADASTTQTDTSYETSRSDERQRCSRARDAV